MGETKREHKIWNPKMECMSRDEREHGNFVDE